MRRKRFVKTLFAWPGANRRTAGSILMPDAGPPAETAPAFRRPPRAEPAPFCYRRDWDGPDLDPVNLPKSTTGMLMFEPPEGESLHGVFRDTLPGSWGTKQLIEEFPQYAQMSDAERLFWLGTRTFGPFAFICYHDFGAESPIRGIDVLRKIEARSIRYIKGLHPRGVPVYDEETRWAVVSGGGARPKAMFQHQGKSMIAKFNVPYDPYNMARVEHATLELARRAGLNVPNSTVIPGHDGEKDIFLVERFDRDPASAVRHHKLSMATLTGFDNTSHGNVYYADFNDIIRVLRKIDEAGVLADLEGDLLELYGRMVFCACLNVTDCHLRNFEMILDQDGKWRLSPMFDVQPDPWNTPFATHMLGCSHRNETMSAKFLAEAAKLFGIPLHKALRKAKAVLTTVSSAAEWLEENGLVSGEDLEVLNNLLDKKLFQEILSDVDKMLAIGQWQSEDASFSFGIRGGGLNVH